MIKKKWGTDGAHIKNRNCAQHERELKNIEKMKELRGRGFSFERIAEVFNSMKIPTKTRKGEWHRKTIQAT